MTAREEGRPDPEPLGLDPQPGATGLEEPGRVAVLVADQEMGRELARCDRIVGLAKLTVRLEPREVARVPGALLLETGQGETSAPE